MEIGGIPTRFFGNPVPSDKQSHLTSAKHHVWLSVEPIIYSPDSLTGPLSTLPPNPGLSQKGGAHWASQWQFFLLLQTLKINT